MPVALTVPRDHDRVPEQRRVRVGQAELNGLRDGSPEDLVLGAVDPWVLVYVLKYRQQGPQMERPHVRPLDPNVYAQ